MAEVLSQKKKWSLTQEAFDKLLACLDADRERAGEKYEQLRSGLVRFFEWRGCPFSEDRADETINRVARRLGAGEEFRDLYTYFYGVARMLVKEILKQAGKEQAFVENLQPTAPIAEEHDDEQPRVECLKLCLDRLPPESREMILQYYQGEKRTKIENREKLAVASAVSPHVLRNRAYRLRDHLQACVGACLKKQKNHETNSKF